MTLRAPLGRRLTLCSPGALRARGAWMALLFFAFVGVSSAVADEGRIRLYLFHQPGCPMCERMKPFLEGLAAQHPRLEIVDEDLSRSPEGLRKLQEASAKFDMRVTSVPVVFLGDRAWVGYNDLVVGEITDKLAYCLDHGCIDALRDPLPEEQALDDGVAEVRVFGDVDLARLPLVLSTAMIALLDGVNPCSLWVLTFLLGMVVHTGSRKKMVLVGAVFLLTTSAVYGLFIVGMVQVLSLVAVVHWVRYGVVLLAFGIGAINVKDFFAFGKGVSLSLSSGTRRRIGERVRRLISTDRSTGALLAQTVLIAAGIAVMELPCTAGFPVIWSNMVSTAQIGPPVYAALLALYLGVYLADEVVVVGIAAVSLRRISIDERRGRYLKLLGGAVLISLAGLMLFLPDLMESVWSVVLVFAFSAFLVILSVVVERVVRRGAPRSE